jgi:hypothetical protein
MPGRTTPIIPRAAPRRILEDASGRRLRAMRWVGRAVALVFLVWLVLVFLGGIGVGPVARLPFGKILRPTVGPPKLNAPLHPTPTPVADLVPALPAARGGGVKPAAHVTPAVTHGRSATAPGSTRTATTTHGKSGAAPGQIRKTTTTVATHGNSGSTTTVHGKSRKGTKP